MKTLCLLTIVVLASAFPQSMEQCFDSAKTLEKNFVQAIEQPDIDVVIEELQKQFETVPATLDVCGLTKAADYMRTEYPPVCTRLLAKEAKILVKIIKLYADDPEKNQKAIAMYTAMFETIYKTQVQKKCPFLHNQTTLLTTVNKKGDCAEGIYQFSLVIQQLDIDLMEGKFNISLSDAGKVMKKLPDTLDSCNQHSLATLIRNNLPEQCLGAIGGLIRELATLEHNYSHLQWLKNHFKDLTKALIMVKDACPAIAV